MTLIYKKKEFLYSSSASEFGQIVLNIITIVPTVQLNNDNIGDAVLGKNVLCLGAIRTVALREDHYFVRAD